MRTVVLDDAAELISAALKEFEELAIERLKYQPTVNVLLTGGTLGIAFIARLQSLALPWERFHFRFSDERFVALDDADRNEHQALSAWPGLANHLWRFPSPDVALDQAATQSTRDFEEEFDELAVPDAVFDICILGMGPDGHIASLFPGRDCDERWVIAVSDSPKPPSMRLSLSYSAILKSRNVIFLASGKAKAEVVGKVFEGADLPAAKVTGQIDTVWFLDRELSDEL